jgi:hypothetical protein
MYSVGLPKSRFNLGPHCSCHVPASHYRRLLNRYFSATMGVCLCMKQVSYHSEIRHAPTVYECECKYTCWPHQQSELCDDGTGPAAANTKAIVSVDYLGILLTLQALAGRCTDDAFLRT